MSEAVIEKAHAKRSPSGAKKRMLCPGSVVLEAEREDRPSKYAAEGTVAHTVMELCLTEDKDAGAFIGRVFSADGFDFEVDMEMADKVNEFVAHVRSFIDPAAAGDVLLVEQQVPIGHITGEVGATGTADVVGITDGGTHLVVLDLKYGKGVRVLAEHVNPDRDDQTEPNEQLCYYGLGALEDNGLLYPIERVTLGIGQPRLDHFDTVTMTVGELVEQGKRLARIEQRCDSAELDALTPGFAKHWLNPGEDQCKFCKAKAICPALEAELIGFAGEASVATEFVDLTTPVIPVDDPRWIEFDTSPLSPAESASERLSRLMRQVPLIEEACLAIRGELEATLFRGEAVDGFKLVQGKRGNRAWSDAVAVADTLRKSRLKTAEIFDEKLKSPSALEKTIGKDKPRIWAKLADFITQSEGKPSVAPDTDRREALDLSARADDYVDLTVADDGADLI